MNNPRPIRNSRTSLLLTSILVISNCPNEAMSQTSVLIPYQAHSASSSASTIKNASDQDPNTVWNSGGPAPAWIQLDLNREVVPSRVRLHAERHHSGSSSHNVIGILSNGKTVNLASYTGHTPKSLWLEINIPYSIPVRYVRITTNQSPSWVTWRDIEVIEGGDLRKNCNLETGLGIVAVGTEYQAKCPHDGRYYIFRDLSQQPYGIEIFSCQGSNLPQGWTLISTSPASQTQCSNYDASTPAANRKIYKIRNNNSNPIKANKPDAYDHVTLPATPPPPNPSSYSWPSDMRESHFNK